MEPKILAILARSPIWAIQPEATARALGFSASWGEPKWEAALPTTSGSGANKLAIIPIQGVLTKDGPRWYGSSYDAISSAVEAAAADSNVQRIVLAVDSPGGDVLGCEECASVIAQAAKVKPVSAIVEGTAASAAYWLTSQARDITLTPSGAVGSVGVKLMHADISQMLDKQGIKVTELHAGDFKTEFSPFAPLTDEAKANVQGRIDAKHSTFVAAVASGRGTRPSREITDARFGEGRMLSAPDAQSHGLVDAVQAPRDFYRAVMPKQSDAPNPANNFGRAKLEIAKAKAGQV